MNDHIELPSKLNFKIIFVIPVVINNSTAPV